MKIFTYFNESYFDYMEGKEQDSSLIPKEVLNNIKNCFENMYGIIMKLYPKIEEKAESFKIQLENAYKNPTYTDGSSYLEEKLKNLTNEKEFLIKQHEEEKQFLQDNIERLERENKIMTDKLIKNAKSLTSNEQGNTKK